MMWAYSVANKLRPQVLRLAVRSLATATADAASNSHKKYFLAAAATAGVIGVATAGVTLMEARLKKSPEQVAEVQADLTPNERGDHLKPEFNQPPPRPDLPTYSMEEVAEHCDEDSMWYTFRGGVYDLTFFLNGHPGGAPVSVSCMSGLLSCSLLTLGSCILDSTASSHVGRARFGALLGSLSTALSRTCKHSDTT